MKLTTVLLLIGCMHLSAASYSQTITLNAKKSSLKEVFAAVQEQTDLSVIYNVRFLERAKPVTISAKRMPLEAFLTKVLSDQSLTYNIREKTILIGHLRKPLPSSVKPVIESTAQERIVTGNLTDEQGKPLAGATVTVKGTITKVTSDSDGNYRINAKNDNATLVFTVVGFQTAERVVGKQTVINVSLEPAVSDLEEVVVVGYGTQRKSTLTGAISSVQADQLTIAPVGNVTNALSGKLPGLITKQTSGLPGSDMASLNIRGFGGPLVIVDGVEGSLESLDAGQIENITILKDGAASIYGARAGNGVVLVTTKRGINQKPTLTFNSSGTLQGVTNMAKPASSGQLTQMAREAHLQSGQPEATAPYTAEAVAKYFAGEDPAYPSTDWYSAVFRDWAPQQNHNISMRGGNEKLKYLGFFGYQNQETMIRTNGGDFSRYNLQSNIDAEITDRLTLSVNLMAAYDEGKFSGRGIGQGDGIIWQDFYSTKPWYPATLPDPNKLAYGGIDVGSALLSSNMDIWGYNKTKNRDLRGTATLAYDVPFIEGLMAKAMVNYSDWQSYGKQFQKPFQFYTYNQAADLYTFAGELWSTAQGSESVNFTGTLTQQYSLNYDRKFNGAHQVTALALFENTEYAGNNFSASRRNFLTPAIDQLFVGSDIGKDGTGSASEMGRASVIGRVNYSYKDKYLLETILRADASAKFPKESRWGYFPSVSVGWTFSKENFMNNIQAVDLLKLRGSYGSSGYDYGGNFQYLAGYQISGKYQWGNNTQSALVPTAMPNILMTWEKMDIYNVGMDFSFFNRKLYGAVEGFYRERSGILATRATALPSTFGANLPLENINSSNDRGFELNLGTANSSGDFKYDITANISWSRAKWDHFEEAEYTDPDQKRQNQKSGQWIDRGFGYITDGLFTSQAEIDALAFTYPLAGGNVSLRPGDVRFKDINGDGVLDWKDQQEIGKGNTPHWFFGLSGGLGYKNFDFTAMFQGAAGYSTSPSIGETEVRYNLRWTETNNDPNALIPRLGGAGTNGYGSDYTIMSTYYLRLKNTAFGYTIPNTLLGRSGVEKLRVYVAATNLFTLNPLSKYNVDPEAPNGATSQYYPQQRTVSFGINLSF